MGSGTTASVAFPSANSAGNLIVVYVVWDNPGAVTLSDTSGNTYTAGTARQTWGNNWSSEVFYASNIAGRVEHGHGDLCYGHYLFRHRVRARVLRTRHGVSGRRQCVCHRHVGGHEQRSGEHHRGH